MENSIRKINYKSDFSFILNLEYLDSNGKKQELGFPDYSFTILLYTNNLKKYIVKYNKDTNTYTNCHDLEGKLQVVLNNHRLGKGRLHAELYSELPNDSFPDNSQLLVCPIELDIELVEDCQEPLTDADITFIAPYAKGDPLRWEDLTEEQKSYFIEQASSDLITLEEEVRQAEEERKNLFNESVTKSNESSNYAKSKGDEAVTIATKAANNANTKANLANSAAEKANIAYNNIMDPNGAFQQAEKDRQDAEKQREAEFNAQIGRIDKAIIDANSALSQADDLYKSIKDIPNAEVQRIANENKRIESENIRIVNEDNRIAGEIFRNDQEESRQKNTAEAVEKVNNKLLEAEGAIEDIESKIAETNVAIESAEEATERANTAAERANEAADGIQDDLAKKADIDKSYPKMTAGFAQEIVGDGSATPEEFSLRPTAGEDRNVANTTYYDGERNGVARIEKIKGNSVVANNCIGNRIGQKGYFVTQYEDGSFLIKRNPEITSGVYFSDFFAQNTKFIDHKYAIIVHYVTYNIADGGYIGIYFYNITDKQYGPIIRQNGEGITTTIVTCNVTTTNTPTISYSLHDEEELLIKKRFVINLTKMFGAGNEPTTVEEFYQRLPVGIDISEYNEGEIIDGNYGAIKTVCFNAFNGTYAKVCAGCPYYLGGNYTSLGFTTEEGGALEAITIPTSAESVGTTPSDRLYTPSQNGYIYAEGENININISWGTEYGYLNGTYQPYKHFERDLSWISKYFPATINGETKYGMRSAGSARDEIRFNSTTQKWEAVQKVGAVDLGTLNWVRTEHLFGGVSPSGFRADIANTQFTNSNKVLPNILCSVLYTIETNTMASTSNSINLSISAHNVHPQRVFVRYDAYTDASAFKTAMSGVMLNYELAEPIVAEIEEMPNMDFDVSDYGTEELIVAEGAQSAPLLADITYAPNALSTIKQVPDILKRLKALESAVASATAINNEETVE